MKRHIVVEIEPGEDGRCGGCNWRTRPLSGNRCGLFYLGLGHVPDTYDWENLIRCGKCLAAEQRLADLVAAGSAFPVNSYHGYGTSSKAQREAWDRAFAALKGGK